MLHFSRIKMWAVLLLGAAVCVLAVPSVFAGTSVNEWGRWAQRQAAPAAAAQGGVPIVLQVDADAIRKEQLEARRDDIRRTLRDARIGYTGLAVRGSGVEVRMRNPEDVAQALPKLRELSQPVTGPAGPSSHQAWEVSDLGGGLVRGELPETGVQELVRRAVDDSIAVLRRRLGELGAKGASIERRGAERIVIQVRDEKDRENIKRIAVLVAKLEFRLVDVTMTVEQAQLGRPPADSEILHGLASDGGRAYLIEKRVAVSGKDLADAQLGFDRRTNDPVLNFRFNAQGARAFARVTQENIGRPFAIVLDRVVISAPVIREPIVGGSGQISGNYTVEQANTLAIILRSGALAAPVSIIEEREDAAAPKGPQ